jgi:hypothetical protein
VRRQPLVGRDEAAEVHDPADPGAPGGAGEGLGSPPVGGLEGAADPIEWMR